ncbi:MAG: FAD-dependent oxidoreductase [Candidatus Brocadiales bacterium]
MNNITVGGAAPCIAACPINQDARDYVQLIARGRFEEAFQLVRSKNTFPASCGRICTRRCEDACRRSAVDDPIAIAWLKRFLSDKDFSPRLGSPKTQYQERIAIIGAGPAGLTAANDLALMGYKVKLYEAGSIPGGMPANALPFYRLDRKAVEKDVETILSLGVELEVNQVCGKDFSIDQLQEEFDAVIIAVGFQKGRAVPIPGVELSGVLLGLEFLMDIAAGREVTLSQRVVVIGGGCVATDVARAALRLNSTKEVQLVCLEAMKGCRPDNPREEMPAWISDVEDSKEEGIIMNTSWGPKSVVGQNGRVTGLEVINVSSVYDPEGRFKPTYIPGTERIIECDNVILAVGQAPDMSFLDGSQGFELNQRKMLKVDPVTQATSKPGVFACGDIVGLSGTLIEAVAYGRRAALSIHGYLRGEEPDIPEDLTPIEDLSSERVGLIKGRPREEMPKLLVNDRIHDFNEVELGYSGELAMMEARRCLNCGAGAEVDPELCAACLTCVRVCPYDVPVLNRVEKNAKIGVDCQSCGICVVECPANAIKLKDPYEDQGVEALERAIKSFSGPERGPKMVVFLCQFDSQCRALASKLVDRPRDNIKTVPVSCIVKMDPLLIIKAIEDGADGIIVAACSPGECLYQTGHEWAKKRFDRAAKILTDIGLEPQRFQWLSPSPTEDFLKATGEMAEELKKLGPVFKQGR